MTVNNYLINVLLRHQPVINRELSEIFQVIELKTYIQNWAGGCFIEIHESGSKAKGTAIDLGSDTDFLVSLSANCHVENGGLSGIYTSLYSALLNKYGEKRVRKQNVSIRVTLGRMEIDVTPGKKHLGNTNYHSLYVSKIGSWKQTNIQKHINDVKNSGRINEIKLIKIWREQNMLSFPSVYIEYLLIDVILLGKSKDISSLANNFIYILQQLALDRGNPLYSRVMDPASSTNILSELLDENEKRQIILQAKKTLKLDWQYAIY